MSGRVCNAHIVPAQVAAGNQSGKLRFVLGGQVQFEHMPAVSQAEDKHVTGGNFDKLGGSIVKRIGVEHGQVGGQGGQLGRMMLDVPALARNVVSLTRDMNLVAGVCFYLGSKVAMKRKDDKGGARLCQKGAHVPTGLDLDEGRVGARGVKDGRDEAGREPPCKDDPYVLMCIEQHGVTTPSTGKTKLRIPLSAEMAISDAPKRLDSLW